MPTAPFTPTLAEDAADPINPNRRLGTFTNFANLCDLAAFAVPSGAPCLVPHGPKAASPPADRLHRQFASTIGATGRALPPSAEPCPPAADEVGLFCIGAHMGGLPLNHQVTALGARFLRSAATVPSYRLYALGNRPGLVRDTSGAVIGGEVWALPAASIGPLLAQVPPPLGFGTVQLEDGPCLGFLAEAAGVTDAIDITRFGGWRAWLGAERTASSAGSGAC
jgi:allophanate hydrolase